MLSKELSVAIGTSLPHLRLEILVSALASLILSNGKEYDTVWDLSNRVCDRYLAERKSAA
jgi:hypothetical protein